MNNLKFTTASTFSLIAVFIINLIPMTKFDQISVYLRDGRWWENQYYDYLSMFPHTSNIAIAGFNHSGLAINMFYPNIILRILELPLVLLNVRNMQVMMASMTILLLAMLVLTLYAITKSMSLKQPFFTAVILTLIQSVPLHVTATNSLPQQLGIIILLWGVYAIINKKYLIMIISTAMLLMTSLTTSMVAVVAYALILILQKSSFTEWLIVGLHGIMGVVLASPILIPILKNLKYVSKPTQRFEAMNAPFTVINRVMTNHLDLATPYLVRTMAVMLIFIMLLSSFTFLKRKFVTISLVIFALISSSPKISGVISSPIQPGTWVRFWIIVTLLTLYVFTEFDIEKHFLNSFIIIIPIIGLMINSLFIFPSGDAVHTKEYAPIQKKSWDHAYATTLTGQHILAKSHPSSHFRFDGPKNSALYSMDYTPITARVKDNALVYTDRVKFEKKYGVSKKAINQGTTIQITVDPKSKVTPLAVWYYPFINYKTSITNGKLVHNKHGMFEYHGTEKTVITISEK